MGDAPILRVVGHVGASRYLLDGFVNPIFRLNMLLYKYTAFEKPFKNSMLVIVMKYSRIVSKDGPGYLASTAVVMSEAIKFTICLVIHLYEEKRQFQRVSVGKLMSDMFGKDSDCVKMMVPAALYVLQNNLQYLAVTMLDPATFQVSYQMKILTTALFSVWLLKKVLTQLKWVSLVLLTVGIALVQLPTGASGKKKVSGVDDDEEDLANAWNSVVGLVAVAIACMSSGLAGVWFEKVLKGSNPSLWLRNIQLSFFSIIPGLIFGVIMMDGAKIAENGFFQGYTAWTFGAIGCQAIGGLIVALVVKYADNILKGFATSISIIVSAVASIFLFDFKVTVTFSIGSALVLYATHLYGLPDKAAPTLPVTVKDNVNYSKVLEDAKE
ncbi:hypothetical protein HDU76_007740 [Blyttiomyces sp. JEL0837]|nr:hypothetical protein HDU76_007740 [Blyttiomyces sp. JEL0837]